MTKNRDFKPPKDIPSCSACNVNPRDDLRYRWCSECRRKHRQEAKRKDLDPCHTTRMRS